MENLMAKTSSTDVQDDPTNPEQDSPQAQSLEGKSALEVLALAGDEAARRALGQPTASQMTAPAVSNGQDGYAAGNTAPQDVYESLDGEIVKVDAGKPVPAGDDGFRGSLLIAAGSVVTSAQAARLA